MPSREKTLPFLDILIAQKGHKFDTKVYLKTTNAERCLNARGECPAAYKRSVVDAYIKRAITHCSTWRETHLEIERVKQLLTNNGFQDKLIEEVTRRRLEQFYTNETKKPGNEDKNIIIYHQNRLK